MTTLTPEITFDDIVSGLRAQEMQYEIWMTPLGVSGLPCMPTVLCTVEQSLAEGYWERPHTCFLAGIKLFDNEDRERTMAVDPPFPCHPDDSLTVGCPIAYLLDPGAEFQFGERR